MNVREKEPVCPCVFVSMCDSEQNRLPKPGPRCHQAFPPGSCSHPFFLPSFCNFLQFKLTVTIAFPCLYFSSHYCCPCTLPVPLLILLQGSYFVLKRSRQRLGGGKLATLINALSPFLFPLLFPDCPALKSIFLEFSV